MKKKTFVFLLTAAFIGATLTACGQTATEEADAAKETAAAKETSVESTAATSEQDNLAPASQSSAVISEVESLSTQPEALESESVSDVSSESVIVAEEAEGNLVTLGSTETGFTVTVDQSMLLGGSDTFGEGDYLAILYLYPDEEQRSSIACQRFDHQTARTADEFVKSIVNGYGENFARQSEVTSVTVGENTWWIQSMVMRQGSKNDVMTFCATEIDGSYILFSAKDRTDDKEQTEISESTEQIMNQCMETVKLVN